MDNPVDVAFTSTGDRLLTATFLEHPQLGKRDALIHAVYGGVYGKVHGVIDGHPRTGELLGPVCHLGPSAPSGLTHAIGAGFSEPGRETFYAALFNMQKVTRHELVPAGATFTSKDTDFVVADSLDFHPTDVIEDADGSLLVVDTGAWYKLCCPTSQLAKPDVPGAIYRVRKRGCAGGGRPARTASRLAGGVGGGAGVPDSPTGGPPCGAAPSRRWSASVRTAFCRR